ncbi:sulfotransferase 1C4-like, partial [Orbicella faveolata]|uniref:sulfotransferase 1C4-like n=1 Tax=Orbicella faveolata TaxID=48498 RepID=UPI0009E27129
FDVVSIHSGTTWVQEIVWQIFNEGQVKSTHFRERVPFLERAHYPCAEHPDINTLPSPRILKIIWNFWNDHVLDWWKHKDDPNVLFLKYEDLQKVCWCEAFILGSSRLSVRGNTRSCKLFAIFLELAVGL